MIVDSSIQLKNQVAIVTGGGRGFGRAMAQRLATAGAAVAVVARSEDQIAQTVSLIKEANGHAVAFPADVTDSQAIQKVVNEVEKQLGSIDLLVNDAGLNQAIGPTWETDTDEWWRVIDVNVRGPYICSKAVLPGMVSRRRGRIINVVSGGGLRPLAYQSAYSVSKTALVRLTENLAVETKEYGISIFALRPGLGRTAMTEYLAQSPEGQKWTPEIRELFAEKKELPPERPAELVAFLASGKADALTGRFVSVYDDMAELISKAAEIERDNLLTLGLIT